MSDERQTDLSFADRVRPLCLRDPLAEVLGALRPGGTFRYTFEDAVKLCGHSCPTVAAAWLMTAAALDELYRAETPVRGQIEVTVGGAADDGGSGPMALVVGLVTGAAPETGFGGLMGKWARRNLLRFDPSLDGRMRFRRTDTGATVEVRVDRSRIPAPREMPALMSVTLAGKATPEDARRFATLWQSRVEAMLADPTIVERDTHPVGNTP